MIFYTIIFALLLSLTIINYFNEMKDTRWVLVLFCQTYGLYLCLLSQHLNSFFPLQSNSRHFLNRITEHESAKPVRGSHTSHLERAWGRACPHPATSLFREMLVTHCTAAHLWPRLTKVGKFALTYYEYFWNLLCECFVLGGRVNNNKKRIFIFAASRSKDALTVPTW